MVEVITIGSAEEVNALKENLSFKSEFLREQGVDIQLDEKKYGSMAYLGCNCSEQDINNKNIRRYLASEISELIIDYWEDKLLQRIVRANYYFFTPEEKENILDRSKELLEKGHPIKKPELAYSIERRNKIISKVEKYLESYNQINIEGFINFRLQDYLTELQEAVDFAVDEFMMEKEYNEFIRLLRYFVDIQEPRLKEVHVLLPKNEKFMLLDDKGEEISSQYLESFFVDIIDSDINYEDLLISALITIAPKELVLHTDKHTDYKQTVKTIEHVFNERVRKCYSCSKCSNMHN